jgi:hypothetical protein
MLNLLRILYFLGLYLLTMTHSAYAMESYNKYWTAAIITGALPKTAAFKYYLESQIRLINDDYGFNQLLLLTGLGYQLNAAMTLYVGPGWIASHTPQGNKMYENRYFAQLNWALVNKQNLSVNSRTRIEERQDTNNSKLAARLRERVWARIPFKQKSQYSFSVFNEVFFNLNHPSWVSPYFLEQNRVFLGIAKQVSTSTIIDIGYLNQYTHSVKNSMNNVLLLSFTLSY